MVNRKTKRTRMRKQRGGELTPSKMSTTQTATSRAMRRAGQALRNSTSGASGPSVAQRANIGDMNTRLRAGLSAPAESEQIEVDVGGGRRKKSRKKKTGRLAKIKRSMKKSARKMMKKLNKSLSSSKGKRKGKGTKKKTKKGKKKMNAYMIALNKARKSNAPSFTYNGKTYYQKKTKTGMVIYGSKK